MAVNTINVEAKLWFHQDERLDRKRGKIISYAISVENLCEDIISQAFIKDDLKEDFIKCLLANDIAVNFKIKAETVGYILKNLVRSKLNERQKELADALSDIASYRNHIAHRRPTLDENLNTQLLHISTKNKDKNIGKIIDVDGVLYNEFVNNCIVCMSILTLLKEYIIENGCKRV